MKIKSSTENTPLTEKGQQRSSLTEWGRWDAAKYRSKQNSLVGHFRAKEEPKYHCVEEAWIIRQVVSVHFGKDTNQILNASLMTRSFCDGQAFEGSYVMAPLSLFSIVGSLK
ncbi:hypothetical protein KI387_029996, partial [Taxus chinensis]